MIFRHSMLADGAELSASDASALLARIPRSAPWDVLSVFPAHGDFPRAHVSWHEGHGFVMQCFEDDTSWGYFLVRRQPLSAPEVDILLDGQAHERWPRELFVETAVGVEALDYFLQSGRQKATLHWVRTDAFARETVWEGRAGREAWERTQRATSAPDV
jgi:hypothetical protein